MNWLFSCFASLVYPIKFRRLQENLKELYTESQKLDLVHNHILIKLLISGEDHRFRFHPGFDVYAILRALRNRLFWRKREGASTIEQQLVRIITDDFRSTLGRKFQEIVLAASVSTIIPKSSTPLVYLLVAYYGTKFKTLHAVLKKYNVTDIHDVPIDVAAEIISRIKYPEPAILSDKRMLQIERRKNHLLTLFEKHSSRKFFTIYD